MYSHPQTPVQRPQASASARPRQQRPVALQRLRFSGCGSAVAASVVAASAVALQRLLKTKIRLNSLLAVLDHIPR